MRSLALVISQSSKELKRYEADILLAQSSNISYCSAHQGFPFLFASPLSKHASNYVIHLILPLSLRSWVSSTNKLRVHNGRRRNERSFFFQEGRPQD